MKQSFAGQNNRLVYENLMNIHIIGKISFPTAVNFNNLSEVDRRLRVHNQLCSPMNQATRNRSEELHCCYSINLEDAARRALEEANQKQHLLESCSHSKSAQLTKESTTNCFAILFKHNSHHLPPKYPGLSRGNTIIRWKENEGSGSTRNRRATDCSTSN